MNETLFYWLRGLAGGSVVSDMVVAFLAGPLAYVLVGGLVVFFFRHRDAGKGVRDSVVILSAAIAAWALSIGLKNVFNELRPFVVLESTTPLVAIRSFDGAGAFPSGHTAFFASIVGSLYFYHRRAAYWFAGVALLIGLSRVVAGVHWPIDIVGGYLLGLAIGFGIYALYHVQVSDGSGTKRRG